MSKMRKRFLPVLLAASMVCGSVSPAYAADLFSADEEDIAAESVEFTDENAVEGQNAFTDVIDKGIYQPIANVVNGIFKTNFTWQQTKEIVDQLKTGDPKKVVEVIVTLAKDSVDEKIKAPVTVNYIVENVTLEKKGKVEIPFTEVVDALQNGVSRETIEADLNTTNSGYEIVGETTNFKIELTNDFKFKLDTIKDDLQTLLEGIQNGNLPFSLSVNVPVQEKVIPNITVTVTFKDLLGKVYDKLAGKTFEVAPETKTVTVDYLKQNSLIPAGYQVVPTPFVIPWRGIYNIDKNNNINVTLVRDYSELLPDESEIKDWLDQEIDKLLKKDVITVNVHYMNGDEEVQYNTVKINANKYKTQKLIKADIPAVKEGWEITADEFQIKTTSPEFMQIDVSVYVPVKATTKEVTVIFMLSNGTVVDNTTKVTVDADATSYIVNVETVTVPENYNLVSEGKTDITDDKILVQVAPKTEKVKVVFMLSDGTVVDETTEVEVEAGAKEYNVNATTVTVPENYNLVSEGKTDITDGKILVPVAPKTEKVKVVFMLSDGTVVDDKTEVEVEAGAKEYNVNATTVTVPENYNLVSEGKTDITDGKILVPVAPKTEKVKVVFMLSDGTVVDETTEVEVEAGAKEYNVNATTVTVPENYNLVSEGKTPITDGKICVPVAPKTEKVKVVFMLSDGTVVDETTEVEVEAGAKEYNVNATTVTVPENYNLVSEGKTDITDGKILVPVAPKTEKVKVVFMLSDGTVVDDKTEVEVEAGAKEYKVNAETVTVPENYNLVSEGKTPITDGKICVQVAPKTEKVKVVFMLSDGTVVDETTEVEVEAGAAEYKVNAETVTVPENYNLVSEGITPIAEGKIYVQVAPKTVKIKVVFVLSDGKTVVNDSTKVKVKADAKEYNVTKDSVTVPKNYNLVFEGNTPIVHGKIYVPVAPKTRTVKVIFRYGKDTKGSDTIQVPVNVFKINTKDLTNIPKGYEIAKAGTLSIKDNKVCVDLKKIKNQTVKVVFVLSDGKTVVNDSTKVEVKAGTKEYNVTKDSVKVPENYNLVFEGKTPIKNGKIYVPVTPKTVKVTITYKTTDGKVVTTETKEVPVKTKTVKVTAPKGYALLNCNTNYKIGRNNTVTVKVKRITRKVNVVFRTNKGNVILNKDLGELSVDTKYVKISTLKAPRGYSIVSKGYAKIYSNGNAYVTVKLNKHH